MDIVNGYRSARMGGVSVLTHVCLLIVKHEVSWYSLHCFPFD